MNALNSQLLSEMIRAKRGNRGLRETAKDIGGISAPTLSRIENGNLPDVGTYLKICKWLDVPSDCFMMKTAKEEQKKGDVKKEVIAHLRADKTLPQSTADALIEMITVAYASIKKRST